MAPAVSRAQSGRAPTSPQQAARHDSATGTCHRSVVPSPSSIARYAAPSFAPPSKNVVIAGCCRWVFTSRPVPRTKVKRRASIDGARQCSRQIGLDVCQPVTCSVAI